MIPVSLFPTEEHTDGAAPKAVRAEKLRAPFQYFGGKGQMVSKLLPLLPSGRVYVEPFCGAASLFFAKQPHPVEVLNDLNGDVANTFRALQDRKTFDELRHRLMYTPYARAEFARALEILKDPTTSGVDRAWAWMVAGCMGFSGNGRDNMTAGSWSRVFMARGGVADTASRWLMRLSMLDAWHWRLMTAQIDNRDALEVIRYWDSPETVFYLDPPYVLETRVKGSGYRHEMSNEQHEELIDALLGIQGRAMVSGYPHPLYDRLAREGWKRQEFQTSCHAAGRTRNSGLQGASAAKTKVPRTEVVWVKP